MDEVGGLCYAFSKNQAGPARRCAPAWVEGMAVKGFYC